MNIYLAAPFFNKSQLDFVKALEKAFEENNINYFSPRSEGTLKDMTLEEKAKEMRKIFESNITHINNCDIMVAVIDDWDTGTVFEIGFAYGMDVPIFTISAKDFGLNVMIRQAVECHNTQIKNLLINIDEWSIGDKLTVFDELTKNVT